MQKLKYRVSITKTAEAFVLDGLLPGERKLLDTPWGRRQLGQRYFPATGGPPEADDKYGDFESSDSD